ncbi:MAG: DUF1036 domain-containing protein [Rhodobacteraceae bacterium]|nr:DUF1036 domain-containing protein [Paracoccaceae bacterium]
MRLALLTASMLCFGGPVFAGLTICNESDIRATIAIGYKGDNGWTSEGWWGVEPGDCSVVIKGDLPKRYYYWRATTKAGPFPEGGYRFCTQSDAFTIVGDEDCDARGYSSALFNEEDIGDAVNHTVTLRAQDAPVSKDSSRKSAPIETPGWGPDNGPGTYGEPLSIVARFGGCWASDEVRECVFAAGEWLYVASEEGPTDLALIDALGVFSEGMRLQVIGDLISYSGNRAEIMIREIEAAPEAVAPEPPRPSMAGLLDHIQGYWDSDAGDGYTWIVQGNFLREIYDANIMRESYLEIAPSCAASNGQGPVIIAWPEPDEGDGPSCYVVTETAQRHLAIFDVIEGRHYSFSYSN